MAVRMEDWRWSCPLEVTRRWFRESRKLISSVRYTQFDWEIEDKKKLLTWLLLSITSPIAFSALCSTCSPPTNSTRFLPSSLSSRHIHLFLKLKLQISTPRREKALVLIQDTRLSTHMVNPSSSTASLSGINGEGDVFIGRGGVNVWVIYYDKNESCWVLPCLLPIKGSKVTGTLSQIHEGKTECALLEEMDETTLASQYNLRYQDEHFASWGEESCCFARGEEDLSLLIYWWVCHDAYVIIDCLPIALFPFTTFTL